MSEGELYKLILMDINMPIMDGIESTKQIRKYEKEQVIINRSFIIALTAADTERIELQEQYEGIGFDGLIGKPISKKRFEEIIAKYLT